MTKSYRRKTYFLRNTSQANILLAVQVILALVGLSASAALYVFLDRDLTTSFFSAHVTLQNVRELLFPALLIINIILLLLSGVINVFFSHRIAGPAYRIGKILKNIADGNWTDQARLRKGDYLKELAAALNEAIDSNVERLQNIQSACDALEEVTENNPQSKQALDDLRAALSAFKLPKEKIR